jgi:PKD repeat protein
MKPLYYFFIVLFFTQNIFAQQELIQGFLEDRKTELGLSSQDISDWVVYDNYFSDNLGMTHVHIRQTHEGIELYNAVANFNIKDAAVFSMGQRLESKIASRINTTVPKISPLEAIEMAAAALQQEYSETAILLETKNSKEFIFSAKGLSLENIPVKLMFQPMPEGEILLVWDMSIYQKDKKHWWSLRVDALTGKILDKVDWVMHCDFGSCGHQWHGPSKRPLPAPDDLLPPPSTDQYRVFAIPTESPTHGPRTLVVGPYNTLASPYGWHDTNGAPGAEFTTTRGNNVNAMEDADGNNGTGYAPNGGAALNFDFPLNLNQDAVNYRDAAITNLFYMNNIMHDIWYHYGFNEASGNFQENNYGRGGAQNDGVIADAQDGSGTNNANFATPADGTRPRMQMFLWTNSISYLLTVNSPTSFAGQYGAIEAGFGPAVPATPLTANLALMTDATPDLYDGCNPLTNAAAMVGRIAVVRRGTCAFVDKVQAAQNAGALAVIVVNNAPGAPIVMGGTSTTINIPSVMVSQEDGDELINALIAGTVINVTLQNNGGPFDLDGDFDNGIIAHEYGHGISTRLTGGPSNSNCLSNDEQMGEGWSDWFGLMLTIEPGDTATDRRGIGTFAIGEPTNGTGIRPAPYSTDFAINNVTYAATNNTGAISMPHGIGFVWCTMLWDMTWDLIGQYGYDNNLYTGTGGNNIAMNLVTTALKLQPCSPGFVDGRNAILQADSILYAGANRCLIWRAFARRGLGASASQGNSNSRTDQVEAFDLPSVCQAPIAPPAADFSSFVNCSGTVNFSDVSTNNPSSWRWDFGDGNGSTVQNPIHTYNSSGSFQVKLVATNVIGSDSTILTVVVNLPAAPSTANVNICENQTATLNATASGTVTWFDASGNTELATGTSFSTPVLSNTTTYMVQNVIPAVSQNVGPLNASIGTNAYHNQATVFTLNFTAAQPFTLVSVWINANSTGNRTINVYNAANGAGTIIASTTVNITTTGAQRINLNLNIPAAAVYSIGGVNMNMLRNNGGVNYPYTLSGVVDITGSSAGAGFYYYYYDWEVRTAPCTSVKIPVTANVSVINNNAISNNALCTSNNGSASVNPTGGATPYSFQWSNGGNTASQNALTAGVYTVSVTDAAGCSSQSSLTVSATNTVLSATASAQAQSCSQLGLATVSLGNGTGPYSYNWSNGQNTATATALTAGTYSVSITDANGCTGSAATTVTNNSISINSTTNSTAQNCAVFGTATATATNGSSPYSIVWSNGASGATINNLSAGTYNVTITDANGCSGTNSVTVANNGTSISSTTNSTGQNCAVLGAATATATNGSSPYNIVWSNGASGATINNLSAGTYNVTITDANGCSGTNSVTVANNGTSINSTTNSTAQNCAVLGAATATATNGSSPYNIVWSNGASGATINNLSAGTYNVTITDANGCSGTNSVTVANNGTSINSTTNSTAQNCAVLGAATATAGNGTSPYNIVWSNGASGATINNLSAGTYNVTITDANGCSGTNSVTVANNGTSISSTTNSTGQNCAVLGAATATATNGSSPYNIVWSNGASGATINNLSAGTYNVTITDANGCSGTNSVTVANNGTSISSTTNSTAQNCAVFGTATATAGNGTSPYNIVWSNGASGATINNLSAGTYNVTITDANGCSGTNSVTVANNGTSISSTTNSTAQNCAVLGTATATATNGSSPYNIVWSNGASGATINNLSAGTYNVTITDANGCSGTNSVTVANNGTSISSTTNSTAQNCAVFGTATATAGNGTSPYNIVWSNGASGATINNLSAGTYNVTITDANGCSGTNSVTVANNGTSISSTTNSTAQNCAVLGTATATATNGSSPYNIVWSNGASGATINNLSAGTYNVTITDANGCSGTNSVTVANNGTSININISAGDAACGASNGTATAIIANGTAPFSYLWSNAELSATINGLSAGIYSITVTDANGCSGQQSVQINSQNGPSLNTTASNISCAGASNGSALAVAAGGSGTYTFLWSNGQTGSVLNNLSAGSYTVTVTDANGCAVQNTVAISEPSAITVTAVLADATTTGGNEGSISLSVTGGTAPYSYNWTNAASSADISGLTAGNYAVTVTDANGCQQLLNYSIADAPLALNEIDGFGEVILYPNPTSDNALLIFKMNEVSDVEISVTDALGRVLLEKSFKSSNEIRYLIETDNWPAAVYLVQLRTAQGVKTKQLILTY